MKIKTQDTRRVSMETEYRFSIGNIKEKVSDALVPQYGILIQTILQEQVEEIKSLHDQINVLSRDVRNTREEFRNLIIQFLHSMPGVRNKKQVALQVADDLLETGSKPEIEVCGLATFSDGTIRYRGSVIPMRDQLNDLCRIFVSRPNQLVLYDDIKEEIIRATRRETITFSTIAKYVSELHSLLKTYFGKDVLFNHKKEGWRFVP